MVLGERIKERLKQIGMSQTELARRIGIQQASVNYLCKRARSGTTHAHAIARELQVSVEWLTGQSDQMDAVDEIARLTSVQVEWLSLLDALPEKERDAAFVILRNVVEAVSMKKPKGS